MIVLKALSSSLTPFDMMPLDPVLLPSPLHLQYGHSPLQCAAEHGHSKTVHLLLDKGADMEAKNIVRGEGIGRYVNGVCVVVY